MNNQVEVSVQDFMKSSKHVYELMYDLLSNDSKDFEIEFNGQSFNIFNAITVDEFYESHKQKHELIVKMISSCLANYLKDGKQDHFNILKSLFSGPDAREFQLEKIVVSGDDEDFIENNSGETSKALDVESVYVQSERPDLDFEDVSVVDEFILKHSERLKGRSGL